MQVRLFVEEALSDGGSVGATSEQAHYLRSVLRLSAGAEIWLFNGRDGEWRATIDGIGKGWASLALIGQTRPQRSPPDIWLLFAPIKRARIDFLLQKSVELGATRLMPVITERTNVERVKPERLRANAIEAAEQCERLEVPEIDAPQKLDRLLDGWDPNRRIFACFEAGPDVSAFADILSKSGAYGEKCHNAGILVGPEGGFSNAELEILRQKPFVSPVGLGPRILRAETAAVAALSIWQALAGDWGGRPYGRGK